MKKWHSIYMEQGRWWALDNDGGENFMLKSFHSGAMVVKLPDGTRKEAQVVVKERGDDNDVIKIYLNLHGANMAIDAADLDEGFELFVEDKDEHFILFRREIFMQPVLVKKTEFCQTPEEALAQIRFDDLEPIDVYKPFYAYTAENGIYSDDYDNDYLVSDSVGFIPGPEMTGESGHSLNVNRRKVTVGQIEEAWDDIVARKEDRKQKGNATKEALGGGR